MTYSTLNSVPRHPRFAFGLVIGIILIVILMNAHRPGVSLLDSVHSRWRLKGDNPGVTMYGDLQKTLEYSEDVYQGVVRSRAKLISKWGGQGIDPFPEPDTDFYTLWDFFIPAFSCPFPVSRIGTLGDGGKWICGLERVIHQQDCIIYSSGVAEESTFEKDILERSNTCRIFGYDYSVEDWGPQVRNETSFQDRIAFKPWKLVGNDNPEANPPEYSLRGVMRHNGHEFIDILKLDIEGSEFEVLDALFAEYKGRPLPFGQLQLELHVDTMSFADFLRWWERLEEAGLRPFWTEPNLPDVNFYLHQPKVAEYSFINIRGNHILLSNGGPYH